MRARRELSPAKRRELETRARLGPRLPKAEPLRPPLIAEPTTGPRGFRTMRGHPSRDSG